MLQYELSPKRRGLKPDALESIDFIYYGYKLKRLRVEIIGSLS
jgi:hypothetical protein